MDKALGELDKTEMGQVTKVVNGFGGYDATAHCLKIWGQLVLSLPDGNTRCLCLLRVHLNDKGEFSFLSSFDFLL
jgi:hypothetical protein